MPNFDTSGCPSDFLALVRKLQADIDDKKNLIAREKQLIEDAEQQIAEKVKATKDIASKNVELEANIEHLRTLYRKQVDDNKRLEETRELLKEQAKTKVEMYEILKEKNQRVKDRCEKMYNDYMMKYVERMDYYEKLPFVPEYKQQLAQIVELSKVLEQKVKEQESLRDEVEEEKLKKGLRKNRKLSDRAKLHQGAKRTDLRALRQSNSELEKEIEVLKLKKENILAAQEKANCVSSEADSRYTQRNISTVTESSKPNEMLPSPSKAKPISSKQFMVPNFRSFFKDRPKCDPKRGASGSSVSGTRRYSLPNLSSLMPALQLQKPSTSLESKTTNISQPIVSSSDEGQSKSIPSLSSLLPQVKTPGSFKTRRPLSEWLNPAKASTGTQESAEQKSDNEKEVPTNEARSKDTRSSWPFTAGYSHTKLRVTEVPLLRQVQEKMLQKKIVQEEEDPVVPAEETNNDNETSSQIEIEENSQQQPEKSANLLTIFDGPTYEVPMQTDKPPQNVSSVPRKEITSPKHFSLEEHQHMMAELQKSPDDYFRYQANIMPMEGRDGACLISPTHSDLAKSPQASSPEEYNGRNEFQFAVPSEPAPGHSKHNWDFNGNQGFHFGSTEDASKVQSDTPSVFSFGSSAAQEPTDSASSPFFAFGGKTASPKSPENSGNLFSFGAVGSQSPVKSPVNFFGASTSGKEENSSSSFASLFGC